MTVSALVETIRAMPDVATVEKSGDWFFFVGDDRRMPFATLVTGDRNDTASDLERQGVYRLNIGVEKAAYHARFGDPPPFPKDGVIINTGHDFTRLDTLLPHPVYAEMHWVCVLNPSDATFELTVKSLLAEAHAIAARRHKPQ